METCYQKSVNFLHFFLSDVSSLDCYECLSTSGFFCNQTQEYIKCPDNSVCVTMTYANKVDDEHFKIFEKKCGQINEYCEDNCKKQVSKKCKVSSFKSTA